MNEPIRVPHALGVEQALVRLGELARRNDVTLLPGPDGAAGALEKSVGFLGKVRGRYRVAPGEVEIVVDSAPAMVGEGTLRRMLGDALEESLRA